MLRGLADGIESPRAGRVLHPVERVHARLREGAGQREQSRVFVPIWKNPYTSVGFDTYVHDALTTCGGENGCSDVSRYPVVTLKEVEAMRPEVVLLPDEPYPFSAEDIEEIYALDIPAARAGRIHLVDCKRLTW